MAYINENWKSSWT